MVQGAVALPQVRAGTIKAIANLSPQRSASMPDIPTSDETGVPGPLHVGLVRLLGAEGHADRRDRHAQRGDEEMLADPAIKAKFSELGLDVATPEQQTPEGLAAFHKAEIEKWWPIIQAAGVKAE